MASTDFRTLPRNDQLFLGLGALVLIASFLPWYGWNYESGFKIGGSSIGSSWSTDAWHGWAAFGLLLMIAATMIVVVQLFATNASLPSAPVSWNVIVLGLSAVGALILIIKSFTLPSASIPGGSYGLRWGGWILVIAAVAQVVVGGMRFRATGEALPWAQHASEPPPA